MSSILQNYINQRGVMGNDLKLESVLQQEFQDEGFSTKHFSDSLRDEMLGVIEDYIREVGMPYVTDDISSVKDIAMSVPDDVWAEKMTRAFRIFPKEIASKIHAWADHNIRKEFGRDQSAVNVVYPAEVETNSNLSEKNLAIYWRCVRPGKPDAGRPHRDASFWNLEFAEGYNPEIPFSFNYLKDCVKIWIPLKGCTPQTTLQLVPRSHAMNVPTTVEATEYGRRPNIDEEWLKEHKDDFISPLELSKGSCIIFDMNLVHRGPTHNNTELRISAELNFIMN